MELSPPPIAAPICPGNNNSEVWTRYLHRAFSMLSEASMSKSATATNNSETIQYVPVGALVFYSYTGLGGVSFVLDGATVTIPASQSAATTASFIIRG